MFCSFVLAPIFFVAVSKSPTPPPKTNQRDTTSVADSNLNRRTIVHVLVLFCFFSPVGFTTGNTILQVSEALLGFL